MKAIIIKSCLTCHYFVDMDDPPHYCRYTGKEFDVDDKHRQRLEPTWVHESCPFVDYPDYNHQFDEWLDKFFPHVRREWKIYSSPAVESEA